jgi:hypothetical protein
MRAIRCSTFISLAGTLALLTTSASAQMPPLSLQKEEKRVTPEQRARQKKLDEDYKAATSRIPDQKPNDPWTNIRPTPAAPAAKKKQ